MKKILLINGSNRKKNTYKVLTQVENILKNRGYKTEILHLFDYKINNCRGCDINCIHKPLCNQQDDELTIVKQKVLESDGVVFSSPVYICGVTSHFKAFADRLNNWVHNPATVGIPAMFVTTTAKTGIKEIKGFFKSFAINFGMRLGDFISRENATFCKLVQEKEMSKFLRLLEEDKSKYKPCKDEIIMFRVQQALAAKFGKENLEYWKQNDWLDKRYFYDCKISFPKKLLSALLKKVLPNGIKMPAKFPGEE